MYISRDRMPSGKVETGAVDHSFNTFCSEEERENGVGAGRSEELIIGDPRAHTPPAMNG